MFVQATYPPGVMATGVIPAPHLLIGSAQAWALILILLVLCCGLLWLLTKPVDVGVKRSRRMKSRPVILPKRSPGGLRQASF